MTPRPHWQLDADRRELDRLVARITASETLRQVEEPGRQLTALLGRGGDLTARLAAAARCHASVATALESAMVGRERVLVDLVGWDHVVASWCRFYDLGDPWDRWAEQAQLGVWPRPGGVAGLATPDAWSVVVRLLDAAPSDKVLGVIGAGPIEDLLGADPEPVAQLIEAAAAGSPRLRKALGHVWQFRIPDEIFARVKLLAEPVDGGPADRG